MVARYELQEKIIHCSKINMIPKHTRDAGLQGLLTTSSGAGQCLGQEMAMERETGLGTGCDRGGRGNSCHLSHHV